MSTLGAIVIVASSYFVCGFCLDLEIPLTDVHGSLIKTIRDHAQRNIFDQQHQLRLADPPLAEFVYLTNVYSSGANENGDITLAATFLQAANFSWVYMKNGQLTCTKGDYEGGRRITTLIDVNVNNNFLALFLQTKSFAIFLYFDKLNITQPGVQAARNYYFVFDAPKTVDVDKNGDVTFDITLPSNYTNVAQHLHIIHTYMNADTEGYESGAATYEASTIAGTQNTRITIRDAANKPRGTLSLNIMNLDDLDTASHTSFSRMLVMKEVKIRDNGVESMKDIVAFDTTTNQPTYYVTGDDNIRYGSVMCSAYGQPKPTVEISKDGQALETIGLSQSKLATAVYVPLDGKTKAETLGVYKCTATSGSKTITRPIFVVE